jgi:hypothetical protein
MSNLPTDAQARKSYPIGTGVIDYFPDALAEVANVSRIGNIQHNGPGVPLRWDRSKSTDEADALMRHFVERGGVDTDGVLHSAKLSWRALALLQKELEARGQVLKFGKRTVLKFTGVKKGVSQRGRATWLVRCDCGREFTCLTQDLKRKGGAGCLFCVHKGDRTCRRKRPYEYRYNKMVARARHPFLITYDEFLEFTKVTACHYCGEKIEWGPAFGRKRPSGLNLDRKDSNLPYQIGNLVVACRRCNYGKNNFFSYAEWKELGALIRAWRVKAEGAPLARGAWLPETIVYPGPVIDISKEKK